MNFIVSDYPQRTLSLGTKGSIETVEAVSISDSLLHELYVLEQDMWAHGLGEYIKCTSCMHIDGKYNIYSPKNVCEESLKLTVSEIEKILGNPDMCCSQCGSVSKHIFPQEYKASIKSRYEFGKGFLSIYKDTSGKVRGFIDGYVGDFDTIYQNEFEEYYSNVGKKAIRAKVDQILTGCHPNEFLCVTSLGIHQQAASMYVIYALMKHFFQNILQYDEDVCGIYESVLGTNTHWIYETCGAIGVQALEESKANNTHDSMQSDIFIHQNIAQKFSYCFGENLKDFLRYSRANKKK